MSFRECIVNAEAEGTITPEQAKEAKDLFDDLEAQYQKDMSGAAASAKAARDAFDALTRIRVERNRRKLLQAKTWSTIKLNLENYRDISGQPNTGRAALALLEQDVLSNYSSVTQRQAAVERAATRKLYNVLAKFRRNIVGENRNKADLKNMVREVFEPGSTGDASAREMAQAWTEVSQYLVKRFNAAGGQIPLRKDWYLPQSHNALSVRKASYSEWRSYTLPRLDISRMIDDVTGLPFTPDNIEFALQNVYETISTEGMNKLKPSGASGSKSLANQRTDHRFLIFKNADAWMEYQDKFGNSNAFDVMFGHITSMSRDIGLMEILGPNPNATMNFLKQTLQKEGGMSSNEQIRSSMPTRVKQLDQLYEAVTNRNNAPIDKKLANGFAGLRSLLQSAQLGSAAVAAITDVNFQRIARAHVGLPQANTIIEYLKILNPLAAEEKGKLAIRLGLIAEGWSSLASGQMRYVGELSGPEISNRVADFVMRASLLSPWTQAGRWAFGMEFLGTLADNVGKTFDQLNEPLRKTLERYGLRSDHWDIMRSTTLYEYEGATFLRAEDIEFRTDLNPGVARDIATRMMEMIETETNFAVPSTSVRGRTMLTGDTKPGSFAGEVIRSAAMYKNFGVTLVNTHIMRGLAEQGHKAKGKYLADLIISTTLMGALAMQLKEMSKGRDPRPMTGGAFWGAALLQGGGLGIFGDFMFANVNRYGSSLSDTIAGPVAGFFGDLANLTFGNLAEAAQGKPTNASAELIKFVQRYMPGGSIWYTRLALERLVFDQAALMADPKAQQKFRRMERQFRREQGQEYWWAPGETAPERAPDIGNVLAPAP